MRRNIRIIIGIAFTLVLVIAVSCKGKTAETMQTPTEATMDHEGHEMDNRDQKEHDMDKMEIADKQGKEYTSKYVCPMHCHGSGSNEEGKCPVCGMTYVMNEDFQMEEHNKH